MALTMRLAVQLFAEMTGALDIERLTSKIEKTWTYSLADGTGAGQANTMWSDTRALATNTAESLDLNGSLTNAFGATLSLTIAKLYIIYSDPANTTVLTVGNVTNGIVAPFGAATHSWSLRPGGLIIAGAGSDATGFAVTASTGDLLKVSNAAGATANYDVAIIGVG
jgi:hypothetical protein